MIVNGAKTFEREHHLPASTFEPSARAVQAGLGDFKRALPKNESYGDFLSKDHLTKADVLNGIRIDLRRQLMQKYLAAQASHPPCKLTCAISRRIPWPRRRASTRNSKPSSIATPVEDAGPERLARHQHETGRRQPRLDRHGQRRRGHRIWAFASGRKVGDVTTLRDANGTFDVVQILQINQHRTVDPSTLSANQGNALTHWLSGQKTPGINTISTPERRSVFRYPQPANAAQPERHAAQRKRPKWHRNQHDRPAVSQHHAPSVARLSLRIVPSSYPVWLRLA